MNVDLGKLNAAVELLLKQNSFAETIKQLSEQINHSQDAFVWSVIDLSSIQADLPQAIRSGWIFVLKQDVWSGSHYHPNSIQHMIVIDGNGTAKVWNKSSKMLSFDSPHASL